MLGDAEFISIDTMTEDTKNDMSKKICEIIVVREDLLKVLKEVF